jgi:hypothetical protein
MLLPNLSSTGDPRRLDLRVLRINAASITKATTFDPDHAGVRIWMTRLAMNSFVFAP